jgi:signal transduction histidine kinase
VRPKFIEHGGESKGTILSSFVSRALAIAISMPLETRFNAKNLPNLNPSQIFTNPKQFLRNASQDLRSSLMFVLLYTNMLDNLRELEITKTLAMS